MFEIQGKVALITGGASGIGLQYAIELLKGGLRGVTLADINEEYGEKAIKDLSETFGDRKAIFIKVDVTNKDQFEDAFKKTILYFKNIDILINNAGILDDRVWEKEVEINVKGTIIGTLLGIQHYIRKFKSGPEGVILNISSIAGTDPTSLTPIYSATKYAIIGLTRSFGTAMHYKISNVRIFAICPGFTSTPLSEKLETKTLLSEFKTEFEKFKDTFVYQEPSHVAREAIKLIKTAPRGSIWVVENKQPPYELPYVSREELRKSKM